MLIEGEQVLLVDYGRAKLCERQALGAIAGNRNRKQRSEEKGMKSFDEFTREVGLARASIVPSTR